MTYILLLPAAIIISWDLVWSTLRAPTPDTPPQQFQKLEPLLVYLGIDPCTVKILERIPWPRCQTEQYSYFLWTYNKPHTLIVVSNPESPGPSPWNTLPSSPHVTIPSGFLPRAFSLFKTFFYALGSRTTDCGCRNSFIQAISIAPLQVRSYSEALSTWHGYCAGVLHRSATGNCEWRTCPRSLHGQCVSACRLLNHV